MHVLKESCVYNEFRQSLNDEQKNSMEITKESGYDCESRITYQY